jgi:hypothetical protein
MSPNTLTKILRMVREIEFFCLFQKVNKDFYEFSTFSLLKISFSTFFKISLLRAAGSVGPCGKNF